MRKYIELLFLILVVQHVQAEQQKVFFSSKEITRVFTNKLYSYHFNAKDSAGRQITYFVENLPSWLSYNVTTKTISGTTKKAGQYPVHLFAYGGNDTARQFFMITVCDKQTTNILCLGNSITNGVDRFNSYRRPLWQMLHNGNYNFDFIGSWSKHHMGTEVPNPDFDMDNEGHSGWRFDNLFNPPDWDSTRGNLTAWLNTYSPDIVLLELGTNDVFQCRKIKDMLKDLSATIDLLRKKNNTVKIFVAQIPPLGAQWADKKLCGNDTSYSRVIIDLNKNIASFSEVHSTAQSPVIAVDQFTGVDTAKDMFDDIHPNEKGEKIMAERWFGAIEKYLKKL